MPLPADVLPTAIQLRAAVSHLQRELRAQARADGLGTAKLGVLSLLYRAGTLSPSQIAQRERVKLQSLTRLLAELEADALVRRSADTLDTRRTLLTITPAGAQCLADEAHRREGSLADAIALRLTAPERARLRSACLMLDRIAEALAQAPAPSGATP